MNLPQKSFNLLFPEKSLENYEFKVKYSAKFKPYNANVKYRNNKFQFNLSKSWKSISPDIKIGLIQSLLIKIFKEKKTTINIDMYNIFMKKIHLAVPKTKSDPILEDSFNRVNNLYFYGLIEQPNLVWNNSTYKLGSYEYGSDTITISSNLKNAEKEILDYVMYHEILHKKHKFINKYGKNYYHTKEFKKKEKEFQNSHLIEEKLRKLPGKRPKRRSFFRFF